jgi:hypothetical protein
LCSSRVLDRIHQRLVLLGLVERIFAPADASPLLPAEQHPSHLVPDDGDFITMREVSYVNDCVYTVVASSPHELIEKIALALSIICEEFERAHFQLTFGPSKTEVVLFLRGHNLADVKAAIFGQDEPGLDFPAPGRV